MDIASLLVKSLELMLIGMGFVYALLGTMVLATKLLARLAMDPAATAPAVLPSVSPPVTTASGVAPAKVAAISAAIHQFRRRHHGR